MNWKLCLGLLVFFALLMSSSYTLLIPFLPVYLVRELGASPSDVNMWSGLIFAITFAISAFVSPLWGKLADRTGRKLMMLRSSFGMTEEADAIENAVNKVLDKGLRTADNMSEGCTCLGCTAMGDAILAEI